MQNTIETMKSLTFGTELEYTGIARQVAAKEIQGVIGGRVRFAGGAYDAWEVTAPDGRVWEAIRDGSLEDGGCEVVDKVEQLAIDRVCELFGAEYANVQPHSGAQANAAVLLAVLKPGDTFMGLNLAQGGHLSHGSAVNTSGILYNPIGYNLNRETGRVDYDEMEQLAMEHKPKLIIADEPLSSLDVSVQAQILNLLADIKEEYGLSLVFISHDLALCKFLCSKAAVMHKGEIAELGEVEDVLLRPKSEAAQTLLQAVLPLN